MNQDEISQAFSQFNRLNIAVIGDLMLDSYLIGKVDRISPEAPVPVVQVKSKTHHLGGAANVALNLKALGINPILFSVVGKDEAAETVLQLMKKAQLPAVGVLSVNHRPTTVKTRIMAQNHQLLRVDEETNEPLLQLVIEELWLQFSNVLEESPIDAVIFEDYDKGVITPELIEKVVALCKRKNIPVAVDPKKRNFLAYQGVTIFKPNLKEIKEGLKIEIYPTQFDSLQQAHQTLQQTLHHQFSLITLSEHGVFVADNQQAQVFPAYLRQIADVSGAGDTVIAVVTAAYALQLNIAFCAQLANLAGGLVCEQVGVVPINKNQLLSEAQKLLAN